MKVPASDVSVNLHHSLRDILVQGTGPGETTKFGIREWVPKDQKFCLSMALVPTGQFLSTLRSSAQPLFSIISECSMLHELSAMMVDFVACSDHWRKNFPMLAAQCQVWALDLQGYGWSDKPDPR